jgi:hypothetical protein
MYFICILNEVYSTFSVCELKSIGLDLFHISMDTYPNTIFRNFLAQSSEALLLDAMKKEKRGPTNALTLKKV